MSFTTTVKDGESEGKAPRLVPTVRLLCVGGRVVTEAPRKLGALTTIGRAPEICEIALEEDPRVSRSHATIEIDKRGRAMLVDRSSNGTELNGARVSSAELADGDVVQMGSSALLYRRRSATAEPDAEVPGFLGDAPAVRAVRATLSKVARAPVTVLLLGETGTGKEVAARAIHQLSARKGQFVAVNCSAIPMTLAESQLFGHVAGAYTGARDANMGFFRAADGGTLFLDELGDLPLDLQPKLLRALEDRSVIPVGMTKPIPVDVRVVAATHKPLVWDVAQGRFRGDLYARVSDFVIELPPVAQRREDVLTLLAHAWGDAMPLLSADLVRALLSHPWPFNVREIHKAAQQLKVTGQDVDVLTLEMIGGRLGQVAPLGASSVSPAAALSAPPIAAPRSVPPAPPTATGDVDAEVPVPDRDALVTMLRKHRGVVSEIAKETGRSRRQVYRWLEQHGLDADQYRDG